VDRPPWRRRGSGGSHPPTGALTLCALWRPTHAQVAALSGASPTQAFAGIDQDGDGALSWDEWVNELFHDQPQQPFYVDGPRPAPPRAAPRRPAPPTGVALHAGELGEVMTDEQFRGFDKDLDGQARRPARAPRSEGTDALSPRGMNNTRTKPSCEQAPPPAVTQASAARAQLDIDEVQAFVNRFMVGGPLAAQPRPLAAREGALCARSGSRLTRQRL
jgi:hypothetical protein